MTQPCPIFVVSLPGADQRRAGIAAQLQALGLSFEFIDGVRGSALSAEERAAQVGPLAKMQEHIGRGMGDGEIGCALSHQRIYERVLVEGHDYAMVLEDDALLLPGFREALEAAVKEELDLLIFGYSKLVHEEVGHAWLFDPVLSLGRLSSGHVYGLRPKQSHHGTVAYLVSRPACERLRVNFPVVTVADDYPFFARYLRVWHLRPLVVMEDTAHVSTIRGDFRRNRHGLSVRQRITRSLRGVWRHLIVLWMKAVARKQ